MKNCLFILLLLSCSNAFSQPSIYSDLVKIGNRKNVEDFILPGWSILTSTRGDLNKDGLPDVTLVLQSDNQHLAKNRILIILFKNTDSTYHFIGKTSNGYILTKNNSSSFDPFQSVRINKGVLELSFKKVDSLRIVDCIYKFRWNKSLFPLIGAELNYQNRDSMYVHYSYNFLTLYRNMRHGKVNGTWTEIDEAFYPDYPAKNLFWILPPFTWEIEDDVYL
ncbi:MAG TPA: hypothetical protein VL490_00140 [Mucilaginibacter sp.]|jgi:hypothetical protein|nr:hypothetical protein [Mucilaginibacter sp.]